MMEDALVDLPTLYMVDPQFAVDFVLSTRLSQGGRCLFFVAMMLLVSTFHENFAILRRLFEAFPGKSNNVLESKSEPIATKIIGERNNDDADMVVF